MKVIASSVRKGNILEVDGQLYAVLVATSFHPGKGTPTTQIDMRRISDGVKTSHRYKTTEQVERAHVEDREFQYLYSDGDGFGNTPGERTIRITSGPSSTGSSQLRIITSGLTLRIASMAARPSPTS